MFTFDENRPLDFIVLGRIAIDINPDDFTKSFAENTVFHKFVGGSSANTAVGLSKLGCKVGFIGSVSDDSLGSYAANYLADHGIDVSHVARCKNGETLGLAFTEIRPDGSSNLMMYRSGPVADLQLQAEDIDGEYIASAKAIVISGTALAASPSREAVLKAIILANLCGTKVIFDVDYRPQTWKSLEEISVYYTLVAQQAQIIMGSREEFDLMDRFVAPGQDDEKTAKRWFKEHAEILIIKHGKDGSNAYTADGRSFAIKPFPIKFLKATGGGDAYSSAFLSGLIKGLPLEECLERGTASASMAVAATNCSDALPYDADLVNFISEGHAAGHKVVFEKKVGNADASES